MNDVLIFLSTARSALLALAESAPVHDAGAIVDRENHETARDEILIFGVCVVIVLQVMKAEHHLATRAAVHKQQRGTGRSATARNEELAVNL